MRLEDITIEIMPGGEVMFERYLRDMDSMSRKRHVVTKKLCPETIAELREVGKRLEAKS